MVRIKENCEKVQSLLRIRFRRLKKNYCRLNSSRKLPFSQWLLWFSAWLTLMGPMPIMVLDLALQQKDIAVAG